MNENYYELWADGEIIAFDTLEEAIEYAEQIGNKANIICEIGGSWDEWEKCAFCEEWCISTDINSNGCCERCEQAFYSRGEK